MQSTVEQIETLAEKAGQLATTRTRIWKLKAVEGISQRLSDLATLLVILVFAVLALTLLSIGAAFCIGSMVHSTAAGFLILGGAYLFTGFLFYIFRAQWLGAPVTKRVIKAFTKD